MCQHIYQFICHFRLQLKVGLVSVSDNQCLVSCSYSRLNACTICSTWFPANRVFVCLFGIYLFILCSCCLTAINLGLYTYFDTRILFVNNFLSSANSFSCNLFSLFALNVRYDTVIYIFHSVCLRVLSTSTNRYRTKSGPVKKLQAANHKPMKLQSLPPLPSSTTN